MFQAKPFGGVTRLNRYMLDELPASRWNPQAAAHLLNRAGFGGTPSEIEAMASLPLDRAVDSLIHPTGSPVAPPDEPWTRFDPQQAENYRKAQNASSEERQEILRKQRRNSIRETVSMQNWWLEQMRTTATPFPEKLALFWHGHFATSLVKVRSPYLMWRQNQLFRRHGGGSWRTLLGEIARDPAMLIWLDQAKSRAGHPNENFARELFELFTLGEGHYTEKDVTEAARAFTGFSIDRANWEPLFRPLIHDRGEKTILGESGRLRGEDVLDHLAASRQSSLFITARLWQFFAGSPLPDKLNQALADAFEHAGRQFNSVLTILFRSAEFHEPSVVRSQFKSPVQWLITACRQLERPLPDSPLGINALRLLGQELFLPPNVKGWEGGSAWINTNTLMTRHNLALLLVEGQNVLPISAARPGVRMAMERMTSQLSPKPASLATLLPSDDRRSPEILISALERRFLQARFSPRSESSLREYIQSRSPLDDNALLGLIRLTLCTPEYQLI